MALTKVSGGILDPGINVAGVVTATGFDGPFIGGSDGINSGIITATGLDVNGNGDISGNLVVGGNLTANGDFTTLNTTLREVELLKVDAQNDNVAAGIITQRGTGNILDLYDTSSAVFSVRDGGNIIMGASAGSITPHAPLHIRTGTTGAITTLLKLHGPFTSNTGSDGTAIDFGTASDTSTGARIIGSREAAGAKGALRFCTGRENDAGFNGGRMVIDETGSVGIGSTIPLTTMALDVVGSIRYSNQSRGAGGSASQPSYAFYGDHDTGMYRGNGVNILSFATAGNERLKIDADGVTTHNEGIFVPDDKSIRVGGSFSNPDLKIHSSSTYQQGVIDYNRSGTGRALRIRATNLQIENWNGLTPTAKFIGGVGAGHVELNYAGSKKFETTSSGVSIGGTTIITSASGGKVGIGTDIPATLLHLFGTSGTEKLIRLDSTSHKRNNFIGITGSDNLVLGADEDNEGSGSTIRFRIDGSEKVRITSGGRVAIGTDSGGNNDTDDIVVSGSGKRGITVCSTDGSECRLTFADGLSGVNAVAGNITYDHSAVSYTHLRAHETS